jgi:hypothetical protein
MWHFADLRFAYQIFLCFADLNKVCLPTSGIVILFVRTDLKVSDPRNFSEDPDLDPRIHASDYWIRTLLFSSLTIKMPTKNTFI